MSINNLKIGDEVWFAYCEIMDIKISCPCCFGKLKVRMILGNDEQVEVPCNTCKLGYIIEYQWTAKPVLTKIFTVKKEETLDNYKIEYYLSYNEQRFYTTNEDDNIFLTEEEARSRCLEHVKNHELEQKQKLEHHKEEINKSYTWHVSYHRKEAKRHRQRLEYHEQQVINCKLKAKTEIKEKNL